ncbi:hypothetical protein NLI96_g4072 [Meripilus lineatus]|uniref:Nucleic acid-binding protein n=1 Tax=Meripilus lineatus TaxID=2056292 RepID=A0AAD5V7S4_9APHY|nr:hypothetical protein NLI96_g4072 [Physisporinus lineatus]
MSLQAAITKLQSPIKELVEGVTNSDQGSSTIAGKTEKDQAEVAGWIEKIAGGEVPKQDGLKDLDAQLTPKTYVVGNYLTAADVALYAALHPIFAQLQPAQYYTHPSLTRYFDHIQSGHSVRRSAESLSPAFQVVTFDFTSAPKIERKPDPPKQKKDKSSAAATPRESTPAPSNEKTPAKAKEESAKSAGAPEGAKTQKKEKKEKKGGNDGGKGKGGEKGAAAAEGSGEPVPSMIDLRVGHIIDIKVHPDADGLYVEQIDFGEETGPRTVVSGLVNYIPIDQMRDKYLVGVCNLKPANMRGVKSFAMVLCATHKDGKQAGIELVQPPPGSKIGERIYFEGAEFENAAPLTQLNPKKKIFETIQPGFTTLESKEAAWVNPATNSTHKIRTKDGVCVAPNFIGASLS